MDLISKDELAERIRALAANRIWYSSVKRTTDRQNDGAVGNTLETLLGIPENNLPIPNSDEWELKGQRAATTSLITLKHLEPSPRSVGIVAKLLLPDYGWRHKQAGVKYPESEMSFRSTTSATRFSNRGFRIVVDRESEKLRFIFEPLQSDFENDLDILEWLESVDKRVGLGPIEPEPYWGFGDLRRLIGEKLVNCFYVVAESMTREGHEYFRYKSLLKLRGFSFEGFLAAVETGAVLIDFDARTGHNHGTKFRLRQNQWPMLYEETELIFSFD